MINVFTPSGLADFLQEASDRIAAADSPQQVDFDELAGRHDLQLIGPPLAAVMTTEVG